MLAMLLVMPGASAASALGTISELQSIDATGKTSHAYALSTARGLVALANSQRSDILAARSASSLTAATPVAPLSSTHHTLVILAHLAGQAPVENVSSVTARMFGTGPTSLNAYYGEQSSSINFFGDVVGDYVVSNLPTAGCSQNSAEAIAYADAADGAASADGHNPQLYDNVVYVYPKIASCPWLGLGTIGTTLGQQEYLWINGPIDLQVIAHEVGHNLGAHHASSLNCVDAFGSRTPISTSCSFSEYGDPFDVMGNLEVRQMNVVHKLETGIWPAAAVQTLAHGGAFTLSPAEGSSGTRAIRVQRTQPLSGTPTYYYLEFRRSIGLFDTWATGDPTIDGVLVHLDKLDQNENGSLTDPGDSSNTMLVNTRAPASSDAYLSGVATGTTYRDPATGFAVTVNSVSAGGASLQITTPADDTTPPSVPTNLVATPGIYSDEVDLAWTPSTDDVTVKSYRIIRDGVTVGSSPGPAYSDLGLAPLTLYDYRIVAIDRNGNASAPSAAATAVTTDAKRPLTPSTPLPTEPLPTTQLPPAKTLPTTSIPSLGALKLKLSKLKLTRVKARKGLKFLVEASYVGRGINCTYRVGRFAERSCASLDGHGSIVLHIHVKRAMKLTVTLRDGDGVVAKRSVKLTRRGKRTRK